MEPNSHMREKGGEWGRENGSLTYDRDASFVVRRSEGGVNAERAIREGSGGKPVRDRGDGTDKHNQRWLGTQRQFDIGGNPHLLKARTNDVRAHLNRQRRM
jgi:hypothetical protein